MKKMFPLKKEEKLLQQEKHTLHIILIWILNFMPMADSYEELISKLKESKVDYLYFGMVEAGLRREFQFLIDPKSNHPGLEVVVYFNNPPSVLYRVMHE